LKKFNILDCTLRDGTYVLDFMIEPDVFFLFTNELIKIGFEHIEIGHGLGLGAWRVYSSGFDDKQLWEKMAPLTDKCKTYSFFIPYIGKTDDIKIATSNGLYGLRIGLEPIYVKKYLSVIENAKKNGLHVSLNLMKSYVITPDSFAEIVSDMTGIVDIVYLVDSAGCMLPNEVQNYIDAAYQKCGMVSLGFHGHNNLGLAVATSLALIDMGVDYIDTTLTGIGRSGGNVPTETLLAILAKKYGSDFFNEERLLKTIVLANQFKKYIVSKGKNISFRSDDILFGYAGFHSSFENIVRDFTEKYGLDFSQTIIEISKQEQIKLSEEILWNLLIKKK